MNHNYSIKVSELENLLTQESKIGAIYKLNKEEHRFYAEK